MSSPEDEGGRAALVPVVLPANGAGSGAAPDQTGAAVLPAIIAGEQGRHRE